MKIENQVCSLEQGKKLAELGVCNQSYFHWYYDENIMGEYWTVGRLAFPAENSIPAFTVAELGVMLPDRPYSFKGLPLGGDEDKVFTCGYHMEKSTECFTQSTEAQARAAMLIYLLENSHITAEEVNSRLNH